MGAVSSWIPALGAGLPALFLALVTWLAAHLTARGDITIGELTAVYGYAAILAAPVEVFIMTGKDVSRALVAARRVTDLLAVEPEADAAGDAPPDAATLHDPESGVSVEPGRLTALAGPGAAAVVDRLGRYGKTRAVWNGTRLDEIAKEQVRARILVADDDAPCSPASSPRWSPAHAGPTGTPSTAPCTPRSRTTSPAGSTRTAATCPAASASGYASPAPSTRSRRHCSRSNPPRPSTRTPRPRSPSGSASRGAAGPR